MRLFRQHARQLAIATMFLTLFTLAVRWADRRQSLRASSRAGAEQRQATTNDPDPAKSKQPLPSLNWAISFEPNVGQAHAEVQYLARGQGYLIGLTPTQAVLSLRRSNPANSKAATSRVQLPNQPDASSAESTEQSHASTVIRMSLAGGNRHPQVDVEEQLPGKVNYLIGNKPSQWHRNVPTYGRLAYRSVYPGIDLVYYGEQGQLEYDFVIAPRADPGAIRLSFEGTDGLSLSDGNLVLHTSGGEVAWHRPVIYQQVDNIRKPVEGQFIVVNDHEVGFQLGTYDSNQPLVIDPTLVYSTYLGGSAGDSITGIAVNSAGEAYITGSAVSTDFPTRPGAFQPGPNLSNQIGEAFVSKLSADGKTLLYSTYLGGSSGVCCASTGTAGERPGRIAIDRDGNAYITGGTASNDFPTTSGSYHPAKSNNAASFGYLSKLAPDGSQLVYSTYFGDTSTNGVFGKSIAVDAAGSAYVTGDNQSISYPVTPSAWLERFGNNGASPGFLTKFAPDGSGLIYSTLVPGNCGDLAVDAAGNAYVTGQSPYGNFGTDASVFAQWPSGDSVGFVIGFNPTGTQAIYAYVFGPDPSGGNASRGTGIAIDANGFLYVASAAYSVAVPTTQTLPGLTLASGFYQYYVMKLDPTQSGAATVLYSTLIANTNGDGAFRNLHIAADPAGNVYVSGNYDSFYPLPSPAYGYLMDVPIPTTLDALQPNFAGGTPVPGVNIGFHPEDAFLMALNPTGSQLLYSSYFGGTGNEIPNGIARDASGNIYLAGWTDSIDYPTTAGVVQPTRNGTRNGFVAKFNLSSTTPAPSPTPAATPTPTPRPSPCVNSQWSAEGNANDASGLNSGTLRGGVTFAPGKTGQAFNLDGSTGYVEVPINSSAMNSPLSFTWEAWVNPSSLNYPVIFQKGSAVFNRAGLQIFPDGSLCSFLNSTFCSAISAAGVIQTGQFTKVTMLYDGAMQELHTYVNNVQVSSAAVSSAYNSTEPFIIGFSATPVGYNAHFKGLIDEVSFSSCAIPPTPSPTPGGTCTVTLTVPDTSNPWLAGMPNGTLASPWPDGSHVDSAPEESPVLVSGIPVTGGVELTFSATGRTDFSGQGPGIDPPDGNSLVTSHTARAEHRVSQVTAPFDSLVGVFLDDAQPDMSPATIPDALDFSTAASRDYVTLSPALKQVFFIGDGKTSTGSTQSIIAPAGATRLFLGTMDSYGWANNTGAFTVTINGSCSVTPTPGNIGGLPPDGGILGPGTPGNPGHVSTSVTGTGHPGCTIQLTVTDPHEIGGNNNRTLTTPVDSSGNWAIPLTLDDCDPFIDIVQICDGISSDPVHRHIFVDGTPPVFTGGGPGDGVNFITGGAGGGTANIIIDGSASDPNTDHCTSNCGGVSYQWNLIGGGPGGTDLILGGGGSGGTLLNGGSGLSIDLRPGDYDIEVIVTDPAGNQLIKHCHRHVRRPVTVTGGLPDDGGIYGPGDGVTAGKVTRMIGGSGNPGCSVQVTISDSHHPQLTDNNKSYTVPVDSSGNWSLSLTLDDCDPVIDIVEICDGADSDHITRHVYVDGTPPHFTNGGPSDGVTYTGGGGGGTGHIVLSGGASDEGTEVPGGGVTYGWKLIGGGPGGATLVLGGGGSGGVLTGGGSGLEIDLPPGNYDFEEQVCDTAGNCFIKHCHRRVCIRLTVTSGLPGDGGIYGPGDGINFGHVSRVITGTGNPGCKVNIQVSDPTHPQSVANNQTYSTTVGNNGTWSLPLTPDDCDPVVTVTEVCDGISDSGDVIRQHIYVDGTPPTVGLADGMIYIGTGGAGGIVLDAGASDAGSEVPNNGLSYDWYIIGGGAAGTPILLCGGCPGNYTINEPAGDYYFQVVVTDRAGNKTTRRCHRTVLKRPTAITYTGDVLVANGGSATLQGVLTDITPPIGPNPVPVVGRTVTLTIGSGPKSQICTGTTGSTGFVRCTVSPVNQSLGPSGMASDVFAGDDVYLPSNNGAHTLVFTFATATGNFVIGDLNAVAGNQVTFWGAQWAKQNSLSGGSANNSFKGFENHSSTTTPTCGGTWTTDPGNSSGPPASIASYMGVIVSSSITKSGSTIAGNIPQIVIVKTDAGYASNPGHAGTGTVVAVFCK